MQEQTRTPEYNGLLARLDSKRAMITSGSPRPTEDNRSANRAVFPQDSLPTVKGGLRLCSSDLKIIL